ncbi:MAG: hypothetical protein NVSMB49_29210 [Ktedonobacteraceae bacterium]
MYTHPKRNEIYRALGMAAEVPIDEPVPLQLQDEDRLLLCSDGLWEMVRDPQGADIAKILASTQHSAGEMAESLVQLALRGGGHNTTASHTGGSSSKTIKTLLILDHA